MKTICKNIGLVIFAASSVFAQHIHIYPEAHRDMRCIEQRKQLLTKAIHNHHQYLGLEGGYHDEIYGIDLLSRDTEHLKTSFALTYMKGLTRDNAFEKKLANDALKPLNQSKLFGLEEKLVSMLHLASNGASDMQVIMIDIQQFGFEAVKTDPDLKTFTDNYFVGFLGLYENIIQLSDQSRQFKKTLSKYHMENHLKAAKTIYDKIVNEGLSKNFNFTYQWMKQLKSFHERSFFSLYDYVTSNDSQKSIKMKIEQLIDPDTLNLIEAWRLGMEINSILKVAGAATQEGNFWKMFEDEIAVDLRNQMFVYNIKQVWNQLNRDDVLNMVIGQKHAQGVLNMLRSDADLSKVYKIQPICFQ